MVLIYLFVVIVWSYLLVSIQASPILDIIFLLSAAFLYLRGRTKYVFIVVLFFLAPLRFYAQAYLGSVWGLFEQIQKDDIQFLLDSILPTLTLNTTILIGLVFIEVSLVGLLFLKIKPFLKNSKFNFLRRVYPVLCFSLAIFFFQQSKSSQEVVKYLKLDKNKYYFGTNRLTSAYVEDIGKFENKNMILFILESVGEKEYNSERVKKIRKNLQDKYSLSSLFFSQVFNIFPGTTRSHLAIHTGGLALTTGSLSEEIIEMKAPVHLSQSFSNKKYKTAVFSAAKWQFENLKSFYEKLKWDTFFDYEDLSLEQLKNTKENSWGYDENIFLDELKKSLTKKPKDKKMVVFINNNTHHPYEARSNSIYDPPYQKYSMAVDTMMKNIESVVEYLEKNNQLENTVIAITGDHGEAFGKPHPQNYLHRNFLYDENIHNFIDFIYFDRFGIKKLERSNQISQGDIYPTILNLFNLGENKSPGFSYYEKKQKLIFFHKNASPEKWGLMDSEWKYIESKYNPNDRELYNLKDDPNEQNNIVYSHKDQSSLYRQLLSEWFLEKRNEFYFHSGLEVEDQISNTDMLKSITTPGLQKILLVPAVNQREKNTVTQASASSAWALLLLSQPKGDRRNIELVFTSPSGKKYKMIQIILPEWRRVWVIPHLPQPVETGSWTVEALDHNVKINYQFKLN